MYHEVEKFNINLNNDLCYKFSIWIKPNFFEEKFKHLVFGITLTYMLNTIVIYTLKTKFVVYSNWNLH